MQVRAVITITSVCLVMAAESAMAQAAPGACGFPAPLISPEVHPDRKVTFRLRAPATVKQVTVRGEWPGGPKPMTKDERGIWRITLAPLEPELYGYSFIVDGTRDLGSSQPPRQADAFADNQHIGNPGRPAPAVRIPGRAPRHRPRSRVPIHIAGTQSWAVRVHAARLRPASRCAVPNDASVPRIRDNEATWVVLGRAT